MTSLFTKSNPTRPVDASKVQHDAKGKPFIITRAKCWKCNGTGRVIWGSCWPCGGNGVRKAFKELCFTAEQIQKHLDRCAAKRQAEVAAAVAARHAKTQEVRKARKVELIPGKAAIKAFWPHRHKSTIGTDVLKTVLRSGRCSEKQAALLIRIANEFDVKAVAKPSAHVGGVKDRLELTLTLKRTFRTVTKFGDAVIKVFADLEGNTFKSFGQLPVEWTEGETHTVVATVVRHSHFKGEAETVINRLSVPTEKKAKAKKKASVSFDIW